MVMSTLTVAGLNPALSILGDTQQFIFIDNINLSTIQLNNTFVPTLPIPSQNLLEFRNNQLSGFRFTQLTNNGETHGSLRIDSFLSASPTGTSILTLREDGKIKIFSALFNSLDMGGNTIINGADPVNPQDFATKAYVDVDKAYGALYMDLPNLTTITAANTWIKIAGTTIAAPLNQFSMSVDNKLTYIGTSAITAYISVSISASDTTITGNTLAFSIFKNAAEVSGSAMFCAKSTNSINVTASLMIIVALAQNDFIEIYCQNTVMDDISTDNMMVNIMAL